MFSKARDFFDRTRGGTSLNGVLPIGERTRTDFDFLHGGLALSGVSFASFHWSRRRCSCVLDKAVQLA